MTNPLAPLVTKLIKGSLTHFYFYAGPADRQGMFGQDKTLFVIKDIFGQLGQVQSVDLSYKIGDNEFKHYELKLPRKTVVLKEVTKVDFEPEKWDAGTSILFLPGGEASKMEEQIGHQLEHIKEFCYRGGLVWATCGAAYWLSNRRTFVFNPDITKCVYSRLPLFSGSSHGPLPLPVDSGFKLTTPKIQSANFMHTTTLLAGGGYFELSRFPDATVQVFATYTSHFPGKIAAVICTHQKGIAMLMHPHLSYDGTEVDALAFQRLFQGRGDWEQIKSELEDTVQQRMQYIAHVIVTMCEKKAAL